jgi:titin
VVAGDRQVTARWTPALAEEGAPITAYRIRVRTDPGGDAIATIDAPPEAIESVITGWVNGTTHYVTVAAVSSAGESPTGDWSTSAVTPQGPPSVPLEATGGSLTIGTVGVRWKPPTDDGGQPITSYRVHIYFDPAGSEPLPGSPVELHRNTTAHEWAGLTEGVTYYVRVTAVNDLGAGPATDLVAVVARPTPAAVPPIL